MNKLLFICFFVLSVFVKKDRFIYQNTSIESAKEKADYYYKLLRSNYTEGNYEIYKTYSDSLLSISEEYELTKMNTIALTSLGIYYSNRGQTSKTIELYHQALEKCELIPEDYKSKIIVLVNMGNLYNHIGSFEKAIEQMEQVLFLLDTKENSDNIRAACLVSLANSYSELKDYDSSIKYSKKAKKIGEASKNDNAIVTSINNISDAYISLKQYTKALEYIDPALESQDLVKSPKNTGWLLLNAGIANFRLEKLENSIYYLKECVALTNDKQLLQIEMHAHEYLAKVLEQKKEYEASVLEQKKYLALREIIYNDEKQALSTELNKEIVSNNKALKDVTKKNNIMAFILGSLLILLSTVGYIYVKRKKKLDLEQKKLKKRYKTLQQEILDSKTSLKNKILPNDENKLKPYKNSSLTPEKRKELKEKILVYLKQEKPFLDPEMTQSKLASKLDISSHHFSEVLYYNIEQNFYKFINSYRVSEAQELIKNANYKNSKIMTIAYDSGFKSKTTFNRLFKSYTGLTPSEYRDNT